MGLTGWLKCPKLLGDAQKSLYQQEFSQENHKQKNGFSFSSSF